MKDRRFWFCVVVLFGGVLMASSALACSSDDPTCIEDAKADFKLCVSGCQDQFRVDKDLCNNIDHACAEQCRSDYEDCVSVPFTGLGACKAGCNDDIEKGKTWCRENTKQGTKRRDRCIDWVQRSAFGCRDQCREDVQGALTQCRKDFRACIKVCPPPAPPGPVPN
jgi:hypothetical protein